MIPPSPLTPLETSTVTLRPTIFKFFFVSLARELKRLANLGINSVPINSYAISLAFPGAFSINRFLIH